MVHEASQGQDSSHDTYITLYAIHNMMYIFLFFIISPNAFLASDSPLKPPKLFTIRVIKIILFLFNCFFIPFLKGFSLAIARKLALILYLEYLLFLKTFYITDLQLYFSPHFPNRLYLILCALHHKLLDVF